MKHWQIFRNNWYEACFPSLEAFDSQRLQIDILSDSPEMKSVIVSAHGMLPILEVLETCPRRDVILRLLRIVNAVSVALKRNGEASTNKAQIIFNNVEIQENLCFVGGIPIISKFASKRYSSEIRLEAAAFVRQMYQTSTLTLQMFVSCGGLNVLVEFLEEDYEAERDLVLIGVNGIWSVFKLQVGRLHSPLSYRAHPSSLSGTHTQK